MSEAYTKNKPKQKKKENRFTFYKIKNNVQTTNPQEIWKIGTLNIRGIKDIVKQNSLLQFIDDQKPTILTLNETNLNEKESYFLRSKLPKNYTSIALATGKRGKGISLIMDQSAKRHYTGKEYISDSAIIFKFQLKGITLQILATYLPSKTTDNNPPLISSKRNSKRKKIQIIYGSY